MDEPTPLVEADVAAAYLRQLTGHAYKPATLRQWAARGHIGRYGRRARATLYSLREIHIHVTGEDPYAGDLAERAVGV
jgi:hypothetical protein